MDLEAQRVQPGGVAEQAYGTLYCSISLNVREKWFSLQVPSLTLPWDR